MPDTLSLTITKVPFWKKIDRSYSALFENFDQILRNLWPWVLVIAAISFAYTWLS